MKVKLSTEYEVDTEHLDPKYVYIKSFAIDEACRMLREDMCDNVLGIEDFTAEIVGEDLYFEKPTQLQIEEQVDEDNVNTYGAIGFQDRIICMDNGHVHPTSAVGDYLTIVEKYDKWLDLSEETIGN